MAERRILPIVYSILIHAVLIGVLMMGFNWFSDPDAPATAQQAPDPIQATVISQKSLDERERKLREAEEQRQAEAQAERERLAAQRRQQEAAEKAAAEEKARQEKRQQEREAREKREAEEAARQKAEAERKAREEAERKRREEEARRKAEAERKAREEAERRAQAERLAQLQAAMEAEQRARQRAENAALAQYKQAIAQKVIRNWIAPPNVPKDLSCKVRVMQLPGGVVAGEPQVVASECNTTDPVVLQSIVNAVRKADPLPPPPTGWEHLFERNIVFTFAPERL